jgi:alkylation response protein AidB-like acyl-CoA dehydrogenase
VLVIPLNAPGVTRRKLRNSGVGASGSTFIEFDDVKVPVGNLLGRENQGFQIIMSSTSQFVIPSDVDFNAERLGLATGALSLSRVCLEDGYMHALTRETFGEKLMSHQIIRSKIGLMSARIAAMHAWLESLIFSLKENPRDPSLPQALSLAKVQGAQLLEFCVREAQQIFGGAGYQRGSGKGSRVEQISRDARVNVVGGGSEEILIDLAVRMGVKMVMEKSKL